MNYKEDSFLIRTYTKAELAHLYNPHVCLKVALQILRRWIIYNLPLLHELEQEGYRARNRLLSPKQVATIIHFWANRSNLLPFYTKFLYTFPQRSSFASTNNNQNKNETFHHISRFLLRNSRDDRRRNSVHYRQFYLPGKVEEIRRIFAEQGEKAANEKKKNCRQSPSPPATEEGVPK